MPPPCNVMLVVAPTAGSLRPQSAIKFLLLSVLYSLVGCSAGSIDLTSLNYQAIDPPAPRVLHFPIDRAFWWLDAQDQLWIGLERRAPSLFGEKFRLTIRFSFVLDKLPAGQARNYRIRRNEIRGVARIGPAENRYTSNSGIMAVYREGDERLRGSFRVEVNRYVSELLTGWSNPSRYLLLGKFEAVRDDQRGLAIVADTEDLGFERDSPERRDSESPALGNPNLPSSRPVIRADGDARMKVNDR